MPTIRNVTVTEVKKVKEDTTKGWGLWNLWIDDPDWKEEKFSYFSGGRSKSPEPKKGKVELLEYEEQDKGEYINYNIKKLIYEGENEKPKPRQKRGGGAPKGNYGGPKLYVVRPGDIVINEAGKIVFKHPEVIPASMLISYVKDVMVGIIQAHPEEFKKTKTNHAIEAVDSVINHYLRKPEIPENPEKEPETPAETEYVPEPDGAGVGTENRWSFNVKPLLKKIQANVVDVDSSEAAESLLPGNLTPAMANKISDYLKEGPVELDDFGKFINKLYKQK